MTRRIVYGILVMQLVLVVFVLTPRRRAVVDREVVTVGVHPPGWMLPSLLGLVPLFVLPVYRFGGPRLASIALAMTLVHPSFFLWSRWGGGPRLLSCAEIWWWESAPLVTCLLEGERAAIDAIVYQCNGEWIQAPPELIRNGNYLPCEER